MVRDGCAWFMLSRHVTGRTRPAGT